MGRSVVAGARRALRGVGVRALRGVGVRALRGVGIIAALAGCGDGGSTEPPVPTTGALVIQVSGLPAPLTATFELLTADGRTRSATAGDTVRNLPAGSTGIRPSAPAQAGVGRWVPARETYDITVVAGSTVVETVQFAAAPMVFRVDTDGLPPQLTAPVRFTAPDGALYTATAGVPFVTSLVGTWRVQGIPFVGDNYGWEPLGAPVERALLPGDTAVATLSYRVVSGALEITAPGLDSGLAPTFTVTRGPLRRTRTGPGLIADLPPGTWTLTATGTSSPGMRWAPDVASRPLVITAGATAGEAVRFDGTPIVASFFVEAAYLVQAVQTFDGATPLEAGRDALLRVFVVANEPNTWAPMVRATLFDGATPYHTVELPAPGAGVDTTVREGELGRSWNARLSGDLIRPGMRLLVEADPDGAVAGDLDRSDNVWPRDGAPRALTVRSLPTWRAVLVPVFNGPNDRLGNVTEANKDQFLSLARRILPVHDMSVRVRAPYAASAAELQANDANGAWLAFLGEINALRVIEGVPGEYWYGVARTGYFSGIAGMGFVPGRAAVGWDHLPSGDGVAAHEWGHNLGRRHAPCGGVSGADPAFPNSSGIIGAWGWSATVNTLVSPNATDLMGYCSNQWISAFNWSAMLNYRANTPNAIGTSAALAAAGAEGSLLVWGHVRRGRFTLEPAFYLPGPVPADEPEPADRAVPGAGMRLRVEALDANGRVLASTTAPAPLVDHAAGEQHAFAVRLPLSRAQHDALASVRVHDVRSPLVAATRRAASVADAVAAARDALGSDVAAARLAAGRARVSWQDNRVRGALVRDAATGQVLGILRAAGGTVAASGPLEVIVSDGVRSHARSVTPR